uniref:Uncharacterized protein n=1 Tax=Aegilops tauschii TaxID=37682 RepID=M8D8Q2_AEGTA
MVFGMNDARTKASGRTEVEDLCSKLTSLLPQDYRLDASQGRPIQLWGVLIDTHYSLYI